MLNDEILNHPIFDRRFETNEEFDNIEKTLTEAGITMPEKFTWEPLKETVIIKYDSLEGTFYADEIGEFSDGIEEVYTNIRKNGQEVIFDESVFEVEGLKRGILGGVDFKVKGGWRMMFEHDPSRSLEYSNYFNFLKGAKYWLANQDDWVAAYQFIEHHPAFWNLRRPEKYPHEWDTENGHKTLWVFATKNDKGEPVVMIEGGCSVAPNHDHLYHDYRLDVWGKNFEDAYIQFAQKLHEHFTLDGSDRGLED